MMLEMIGCYCQTELGHGSNVRGLRTEAHYNHEYDCFILTTPTLCSIKWWPGGLGKICTHALIYAQLFINKKEYGIQTFLIQIRDNNHRPLPNIEVGDIGPKLGDNANDTGFLRLDSVAIPRKNMLSRYQYIDDNGIFHITEEKKQAKQLHYATMMFTRGSMVKTAGGMLARASTIASRYSCIRKQGYKRSSEVISYKDIELPIIDQYIQRYRICKWISLTYALKCTGTWLITQFQLLENSELGVISGITNIESLNTIASTTAGLKGLTTLLTCNGIEDLRKSCGGNGYLLSSGIGALSIDYVWQTTAEGDFIVLLHQTARFIIKSIQQAIVENNKLTGPMEHLQPLINTNLSLDILLSFSPSQTITSYIQLTNDLNLLLDLYKYRSLVEVSIWICKQSFYVFNYICIYIGWYGLVAVTRTYKK